MTIRIPLAGFTLVLTAVLSTVAVGQPCARRAGHSLVTFYAMGDVPYAPQEDVLLPQHVAELPQDAEFVVHVGDIKGGATPCDEAVYVKVAGMLRQSIPPVFIIPGDNEWNDCTNPAEAWGFWVKHFMRFDQHWHHRLPVHRQLEREENFSFVKNNVLCVGLNIVGGLVHDPPEWKQRHVTDLKWIHRNIKRFGHGVTSMVVFGHAMPAEKHNDFFIPFNDEAREFGKPILYLHGDGHKWIHDRPFTAQNILRVQVDQGGIAPPLKVTVTDAPKHPFEFDRRKSDVAPAQEPK
ncbi:MAG: hypothetical protein GY758_28025, partial [Fuerstiella sp.]|nr:hypothetical protein [Fuerstiella sp.]